MLEYLVSSAAVASGWSGTFVGLLSSAGITLPKVITEGPSSGGLIDLPAVLIVALVTWSRFVIWLLIGIVIYFVYGRHHSILQKSKPMQHINTDV